MMERTPTWEGQGTDHCRDRGQKRPSRPSLFDVEDARDLKKVRPDDDFAVRGRASSRDPRRRPVVDRGSDFTPLSASRFSESSSRPADDDEDGHLATPYAEMHPDRREWIQEREQEYPLSPRSKSPDIDERREVNERERPKPNLRYSSVHIPDATRRDSYSQKPDIGRAKSRVRDDLGIDTRRRSRSRSPKTRYMPDRSDSRDERANYKSSPLNYDSYSPVPNEGRKSSNSFRSREIEFAWSDIRADPLNPKPTVSSSIRRQSSDSLAMPSIVQELTQYADAITKNASIKIRLDLKNEEVKQQECPNRRLAKHKKEWQPIGESMDCAAGAVAKDASRLADHQAKSNMAQAEMTKKLAVKLQRAESSASLPSSNAATISEKEFLDLKKELRDTKSALLDVQETMDSIRRHAIMERDLDNRGYVDKEQIRKIKTDENVGLENKVATLLVDMSKHYDNEARERKKIETIISSLQTFQSEQSSRNTTQMAAAKALSNMVIGKLDGHAKNMEEFRSSMVADQDTKINAYLNQHLQDYKATKSDLETRFGTAMAEMQQLKDAQAEIVQRQTAHAEAAQAQAAQAHDQVQAACTEEGHASVTDLGSNISESAINAMIWEIVDKEMLKQKEDQEEHQETLLELTANLEKKVAGLEQQQVRHGTLTNEIDGLRLAVDSMIRSYNSQSQNMAVFQHPGLQRPRQPVPSQPPTPPTTNVGLGDLNVMGEALFQRLKDLENRQIQLDIRQDQTQTFVRSQQQKFDNLTSTQLAQNMVDHLSRVYPYHPANTIGQIQNLNSCQKQMDTAIRHHALKLKSLDVEPITQIISDYPTCKRLASDAFRLVNQHQGHLTTLESKFPSQLQDAEKGILAKLNDEHDNSVAALTSVHTRMDEIVESFKTETITRTEELAKVKKDIDYFRKLEELMRTKQNLVSNPCDSDTEAETPLLEERSRHGTTISTSSASSKKRTPETSLGEDESDDEDAIIAHPNKRRRSNKPSEQKRHGVSKS